MWESLPSPYNTHYFADPTEDMIGVIMSQNYPYTLELSQTFENGAYQALTSVPEPSILWGLFVFSSLGFWPSLKYSPIQNQEKTTSR